MALLDADDDGALDVLLVSEGVPLRLLLGDGAGSFLPGPVVPGSLSSISELAAGDVDGDGREDVLVGRLGVDILLWGLPGGRFAVAGDHAIPALDAGGSPEVADFDGDGDLDIVYFGLHEVLLRNDGSGRFRSDSQAIPPNGLFTSDGAVADVDGDGDVDLWVANDLRPLLYLNDGSGDFADATSGRVPQLGAAFPEVFAADFDGDGDADLYGRSLLDDDYLLINDGTGRFRDEAAARLPTLSVPSASGLLIEDFDADGDLDLMMGGASPVYWRNDGTGRFVDASASVPAVRSFFLNAGDIDGDGDLDVVLDNDFLHNDGAGNFRLAPAMNLPRGPAASLSTSVLVDADRDGDLDLIYGGDSLQGFRNDGSGVFRSAGFLSGDRFNPSAAADFDGDGDDDLLMGTVLFRNHHRQLRAPRTPRVGDPYRLELSARPGYGVLSKVGFVAISAARVEQCVPQLGCLQVDLGGAVLLPAVTIQPPASRATIPLPIPAVSALRGLPLVTQALLIDFDGDSQFTNWIEDEIR